MSEPAPAPDRHRSQPELVWYAAYGSNLLAARFSTYLTGGQAPHRPTARPQAGARNPAPPHQDRAWPLPHPLFFAGTSPGWGGAAVAMLDPTRSPAHPTLGRIWLITAQQFEDVFRQENGQRVPDGDRRPLFSVADAAPGRPLDVLDAWYGRVVHLGPGPGGHPVVTMASPDPSRHRRGPAHPSYLRTIGLGLAESWGLSARAAAEYLVGCEGNAGAVPVETLHADLAAWIPGPRPDRPI